MSRSSVALGPKIAAIGGLTLLYLFGIYISGRALVLSPQGEEFGPGGHSYPPWTIVHFASALLFAVLALMQFISALQSRYPRLHRYLGRIAVAAGLLTALTGAWIPFAVVPPRPLLERLYIVVYFAGVASFLLLGFRAARRRNFPLHRIWMIRTVASAGAVMTQRLVFPVLAVTLGIHSDAAFWTQFVGAFAAGWAINLGLAEGWLRWSSPKRVS